MKHSTLAAIIVVALLISTLAGLFCVFPVTAQSSVAPELSMPIEQINYTITDVNGSLWAKIDGNYPITVQNLPEHLLPMVYPMPPNSTNIHLHLNGTELAWDNYTAAFPAELHRTAIGDWWMISALLSNLSDSFVLSIHYEHPLEQRNGTSMFLYDLNIADYLSAETPDSTAYFNIQIESNVSDVHVYTAPADSTPDQWQPKAFTETDDGASKVLTVEMHSQYGASLPGDLVVAFSVGAVGQQDGLPSWVIPVVIDLALMSILIYAKRRTLASAFSSSKTTN